MAAHAAHFYLRLGVAVAAAWAVLLLIAAWLSPGLMLSAAIASSEKRPAGLEDAQWGHPVSAHSFRARFRPGTPEKDLLAWLADNRFTIERGAFRAHRRIQSLPCNERVDVTLRSKPDGRLDAAEAKVREAGCL